jgi:hypothetical protein
MNYSIQYIPWEIKSIKEDVWNVFIVSIDSHSLRNLIEIKRELNECQRKGYVVVQTTSRAARRLGWNKFGRDMYYKYCI